MVLAALAVVLFVSSAFFVIGIAPTIDQYVRHAGYYTGNLPQWYVLDRVADSLVTLPTEEGDLLYYYTVFEVADIARGTPAGIALVESMDSSTRSAANLLLDDIFDDSSRLVGEEECEGSGGAEQMMGKDAELCAKSTTYAGLWGKNSTGPGGPTNGTNNRTLPGTPAPPVVPPVTPPPGTVGACPGGALPPTGTCRPGQTKCNDYAHCPTPRRGRPDVSSCFGCTWVCGPAGTWTTGYLCAWPVCHTTTSCT